MYAHIVVGLGYGDEGKGLTTDYLCNKLPNPIVVRFSGGQQAGHTVMIGDKKHTFSNFGAGTFRGAPTYYSEHTTFYPVNMKREFDILVEKGVEPTIYIHPLAKLTTPFDVYANRNCKDNLEHGTCGLGVGKTMKRQESPVKLYAIDILNEEILIEKLTSIATWYGYEDDEDFPEWIDQEGRRFAQAINDLPIKILDYKDILPVYDNIIFEGSQGILLDMHHGNFPYVTYSNTTSKNAQEVCDKLGIHNINRVVYGVTRAYSTRHGNGPFKVEPINLTNTKEEINKSNQYQGDFKVSKMNYELLNYAISTEKIYSRESTFNLVVTCNDQIVDKEDEFDMSMINYNLHSVLNSFSPDSSNMK